MALRDLVFTKALRQRYIEPRNVRVPTRTQYCTRVHHLNQLGPFGHIQPAPITVKRVQCHAPAQQVAATSISH